MASRIVDQTHTRPFASHGASQLSQSHRTHEPNNHSESTMVSNWGSGYAGAVDLLGVHRVSVVVVGLGIVGREDVLGEVLGPGAGEVRLAAGLGEVPEANGEEPDGDGDDNGVVHLASGRVHVGGAGSVSKGCTGCESQDENSQAEQNKGKHHPHKGNDGNGDGELAEVPRARLEEALAPDNAGEDGDTVGDVRAHDGKGEDGAEDRVSFHVL